MKVNQPGAGPGHNITVIQIEGLDACQPGGAERAHLCNLGSGGTRQPQWLPLSSMGSQDLGSFIHCLGLVGWLQGERGNRR